MLIKQRWIYIGFLFMLFPISAYSQLSFKKLQVGKTGYGLEFSPQTNVTTIGARVDYGINRNSKIYLGAAIAFTDDKLGSYGREMPPSPGVGLGVLHIQPLGRSDLEYFLHGGFGAALGRIVDNTTSDTIANLRTYTLSGGTGILKRFKTESDWVIIPYFGLSYTNTWSTYEDKLLDFEGTNSDGSFGGTVGVEIEVSPKMSGVVAFGFLSSSDFSLSLNFH